VRPLEGSLNFSCFLYRLWERLFVSHKKKKKKKKKKKNFMLKNMRSKDARRIETTQDDAGTWKDPYAQISLTQPKVLI